MNIIWFVSVVPRYLKRVTWTLPFIVKCRSPVSLSVEGQLWHESALACATRPVALELAVQIRQKPSPHWAAGNSRVKCTGPAAAAPAAATSKNTELVQSEKALLPVWFLCSVNLGVLWRWETGFELQWMRVLDQQLFWTSGCFGLWLTD